MPATEAAERRDDINKARANLCAIANWSDVYIRVETIDIWVLTILVCLIHTWTAFLP
jgi:hypothetical protein